MTERVFSFLNNKKKKRGGNEICVQIYDNTTFVYDCFGRRFEILS